MSGAIQVDAHSGRTDSSGCHNDRSNGTYHCHNGGSSSSSSSFDYDYQYKDVDSNGINDYEQDWDDLSKNISAMGYDVGVADAEYGDYNPNGSYQDFSNSESDWYKHGYEEGYHHKRKLILEKEAYTNGHQSGLQTDKKNMPSKYNEYESVKNYYDKGFVSGQEEKWELLAEEAALAFKELKLPEELPEKVKESALKKYEETKEKEMKRVYEDGYASAFINEQIMILQQYNNIPYLKDQFVKGYQDNNEIINYKEEAYQAGLAGNDLNIPSDVLEDDAEEIYQKYYEQGKAEYQKIRAKWIAYIVFGLIVLFGVIFSIVKLTRYRNGKKDNIMKEN